jgi:hypothetical protein
MVRSRLWVWIIKDEAQNQLLDHNIFKGMPLCTLKIPNYSHDFAFGTFPVSENRFSQEV